MSATIVILDDVRPRAGEIEAALVPLHAPATPATTDDMFYHNNMPPGQYAGDGERLGATAPCARVARAFMRLLGS